MRYLSTRGHADRKHFCEILLEGLAPDGGLYLPERYPQVDAATLARWRGLPYADLAFEILSLYIDDIPAADLRALCRKTYTQEVFGSREIVPLKKLEDGLFLEALSNGPTLAFKDMAMQLLGNLFEYELARRGEQLNILGATSGDTGSAAEYAMRGKKGVRVFMTSPHGRMSPFQQAQMFSLQDPNIHNLAIEGVFDDCQDIVKAVSNDLDFKRKYKIGTVNSINWARLMAQIVYYFAGYFQATNPHPARSAGRRSKGQLRRPLGQLRQHLCRPCRPHDGPADRPSGPGHQRERRARRVLPHRRVPRARPVPTRTRPPARRWTSARPATSNASCSTCWAATRAKVRRLFGEQLARDGRFDLSADPAFPQARATLWLRQRQEHPCRPCRHHPRHLSALRPHHRHPYRRRPEGGSRAPRVPGVPMIVLETALPIKFAATIVEALGREPERPARFAGIERLPKRVTVLPADVQAVKGFIAGHCG